MKKRGRKPLLKPEEADEIRELYYRGSTQWKVGQLANAFKVSEGTIHQVLDRKGAYARKTEME